MLARIAEEFAGQARSHPFRSLRANPMKCSFLTPRVLSLFLLLAWRCGVLAAEQPAIPTETTAEAKRRHERVAERRKGPNIICHRGASEHAHENTLEAFRATFELGGDGNEFDIRITKDGVLVVFHDDMLDRLLEAFGDVSEYTWEQLRRFRFRNPGRFGEQCRIPTLVEVFELHRKFGGLIHLDIKRPGFDRAIADLLTRMDMWDHIAYCNENADVIVRDPRLKLLRYKASLYSDRSEVFPEAIATALKKPGDGVIVDDPRGVAVALGRKLSKLSKESVSRRKPIPREEAKLPSEAELIASLRKADDWDRVAESERDRLFSAAHIQARALVAEQLLAIKASSKDAYAALEERVRKRSLHKEWMYHGFDGAMALRSLILLRAPNAVETARFVLWRDDPALEPVIDPRWKNPRSWTDFRVKMVAWPALCHCPGPATEKLCREYLALSDEAARKIGPPQFEEAGKALLAVSPRTETALELMKHRLQAVRGRAILGCLNHAGEPWAPTALTQGAPHALAYIPGQDKVSILIQTDRGDIEVELDSAKAPITVGNFLRYVDGKFYDGGRFHRTVKPDNQPVSKVKIEVIQAGIDPSRVKEEFPPIKLERTRDTSLRHKDGTLSMARNGPDTATSDFFICIGDQPELDFGGKRNPDGQGFAAFGRVVKGMDVVRKSQSAPAEGQDLKPPIKILKVTRTR
jgi:peptidyl-prolyl cis-trans isomerase A (cyclophilin A)